MKHTLPTFIAALFCFASLVHAQDGALTGTVRDSDGVVPGASVIARSGGRQVATATTDAAGTYRFTNLAPGAYELTVTLRGFEPVVRQVTVGTAAASPVNFDLVIGRVSTTLSVTASGGRATASRLPVSDLDIPAQVTSIPQELMRQQGTNTVADALRNVSGVQAVRWYGAYEQYTMRGFFDPDRDGFNAVLVDGMRRFGNRYGTQSNNLQSVDVLKGPASILYGRGAVGGVINLVRRRPEATPSYEASYRVGRFNTHQVSGGATGPIGGSARVLYRIDTSFEASDGWRGAGADRFGLSPSLTFVLGDQMRLTLQQDFHRDRFDGDGGVPFNITNLPNFKREARFSLPQDKVLVEDSQTQALFTARMAPGWEFRNSLLIQRTSDQYFVTEGVYGDPDANLVYREPLDFHHIRRPIQNQAEIVGTLNGFGRHTLLAGYEFQRDKYRSEVTAGDDPDCLCGYWYLTIEPMDITTMVETQPGPLDLETIERTTFVNDQTHALYVQDQIDVTAKLKLNFGTRVEDYSRRVTRQGGLPFTPVAVDQNAFSYRAGVVFLPRPDQQLYFGTSTSFTPVNTVPPDGTLLDPSTARNYELGHRWQGFNGRVDTNMALYFVAKNNLNVREGVNRYIQVGEQTSRGIDIDVNTNLGRDLNVVAAYGYTHARFGEAEALTGKAPRFVPTHSGNVWLHKSWTSGLNASIGVRFLGEQFVNNANTVPLESYSIVSAAVGYRTNRWDWSLNLDNMLNNEDYFLPGHFSNLTFPGPPIGVTTAIRWRFN